MNEAALERCPYIDSVRRVFVAGALFAAAAAAGRAAEPSWQAIGPDGGPVVSLVRDPTAPARVWVSTGRIGVLRSEDGGESWTPSNEGLLGKLRHGNAFRGGGNRA